MKETERVKTERTEHEQAMQRQSIWLHPWCPVCPQKPNKHIQQRDWNSVEHASRPRWGQLVSKLSQKQHFLNDFRETTHWTRHRQLVTLLNHWLLMSFHSKINLGGNHKPITTSVWRNDLKRSMMGLNMAFMPSWNNPQKDLCIKLGLFRSLDEHCYTMEPLVTSKNGRKLETSCAALAQV